MSCIYSVSSKGTPQNMGVDIRLVFTSVPVVVLLLSRIRSGSCLEYPHITVARHTSLHSIVVEWILPDDTPKWQVRSSSNDSGTWWNNTRGRHQELSGFNLSIFPQDDTNVGTAVPDHCQTTGITASMDRDTRKWTFWRLDAAKTYLVCVKAFTNTDESTWTFTTVRPEGRRPPRLIRTSPARIYVDHLQHIVLDCLSDGIPKPNITWYTNGHKVVTKSLANGSLSLGKKSKGTYQCHATNKYGIALSSPTELICVPGIPSRTQKEEKVTVKHRHWALLPCDVPDACMTKVRDCVSWATVHNHDDQYPVEVKHDDRILLLRNGSLLFVNVERGDAGLYECRLHGANGYVGGQFRRLQLTGDDVTDGIHPILLLKSTDVLAIEGKRLDIYCIFAGWPTPNVTWERGETELNFRGPVLSMSNVIATDAGSYGCAGENGVGHKFMQKVEVKVESGPTWLEKPRDINVTEGGAAVFNCAARGTPDPQTTWYINGKILKADRNGKIHVKDHKLKIMNLSRTDDTMCVQCNVSNIHGFLFTSVYLNVVLPTKIVEPPRNSLRRDSDEIHLQCNAETDPGTALNVHWLYNNKTIQYQMGIIEKRFDNSLMLATNNLSHAAKTFTGQYTCVASNGVSSDRKSASVLPQSPLVENVVSPYTTLQSWGELISILVAVAVLLVLVTVGLTAWRKRPKTKPLLVNWEARVQFSRLLSEESLNQHWMDGSADVAGPVNPLDCVRDDSLKILIREVLISREKLRLGNVLGKGHFGKVFSGVYQGPKPNGEETKVAIKTLKYNTGEPELSEKFLREAVLMRDFHNEYILSLIGISFEADGSPMVVLPFMENGDLRNFVQNPNREVTVLDLLRLGLQVARGMQYLSEMRFVHRDLAARNCMVDESWNVKVGDFGLSRDLYSKEYYRMKDTKTGIPVRWMAPEILEGNCFTVMSDVWSYGILVWELMTRGRMPYSDIDSWDVKNFLRAGHRLEQPYHCPDSVYSIMLQCWHIKPARRPSFSNIIRQIGRIVRDCTFDDRLAFPGGTYMNMSQNVQNADYRNHKGATQLPSGHPLVSITQ